MFVDIIIITVVCTDLMSIGRKLVLCSSDTTQHVLSVLKEGEEGNGEEDKQIISKIDSIPLAHLKLRISSRNELLSSNLSRFSLRGERERDIH